MSKSKLSFKPMLFDKKSVELFKQEARNIKRSTPLTHTQALDLVVQKHGFRNWNHYIGFHKTLISPALAPFGLCLQEPPSAPCPLANSNCLYCNNALVDMGEQ